MDVGPFPGVPRSAPCVRGRALSLAGFPCPPPWPVWTAQRVVRWRSRWSRGHAWLSVRSPRVFLPGSLALRVDGVLLFRRRIRRTRRGPAPGVDGLVKAVKMRSALASFMRGCRGITGSVPQGPVWCVCPYLRDLPENGHIRTAGAGSGVFNVWREVPGRVEKGKLSRAEFRVRCFVVIAAEKPIDSEAAAEPRGLVRRERAGHRSGGGLVRRERGVATDLRGTTRSTSPHVRRTAAAGVRGAGVGVATRHGPDGRPHVRRTTADDRPADCGCGHRHPPGCHGCSRSADLVVGPGRFVRAR